MTDLRLTINIIIIILIFQFNQYSSPYHHSTNGIFERQFRTVRDAIHISLKDKFYTNWADLLPEVEFMINSTVQSTIGFSPAEIVYGKKIYSESDLTINEYMEEQSKIRQITQDKMQTNVAKTKYDNSSRINRHFNIGEKVLVKKDAYY